jgi:hypothetical protein
MKKKHHEPKMTTLYVVFFFHCNCQIMQSKNHIFYLQPSKTQSAYYMCIYRSGLKRYINSSFIFVTPHTHTLTAFRALTLANRFSMRSLLKYIA